MLVSPERRLIATATLVGCVGLAAVFSLFALLELDHRITEPVTLRFLNRSETNGWNLVHFELRVPKDRRVLTVPRAVDETRLWVRYRPPGLCADVAERIRELQIIGSRRTVADRPPKYPTDPSLQGWLSWTTYDFIRPPGYRGLGNIRLGPNTNLVITVVEPRVAHWRLELNTLQWHVGSSTWPFKAKRLWKTKRLSALKGPVGFGLRLQSEWISEPPPAKPDVRAEGRLEDASDTVEPADGSRLLTQ